MAKEEQQKQPGKNYSGFNLSTLSTQPDKLSNISAIGSAGVGLAEAVLQKNQVGARKYGDISAPAMTLTGTKAGLSIGLNPTVMAATGGISAIAAPVLGLGYDFVNRQIQLDRFRKRVQRSQNNFNLNEDYNAKLRQDTTGLMRKGGEATDPPKMTQEQAAQMGYVWDNDINDYTYPSVLIKEKYAYDFQKTKDMPQHSFAVEKNDDIKNFAKTAFNRYNEVYNPKSYSCLGTSCYAMDMLSKDLDLPSSNTFKQKIVNDIYKDTGRQVNTSWDFYGGLKRHGAEIAYETPRGEMSIQGNKVPSDVLEKIKIGTYIGMNNTSNTQPDYVSKKDWKENNLNVKEGIAATRHTGVVIGFDDDKTPLVFSLGEIHRLDDDYFKNKYNIAHIMTPKEYSEKNYTADNYLKKTSKEIYATDATFGIDDATNKQEELGKSIGKWKAKIMSYTGIDDETYNELGQIAMAISQQETAGMPKLTSKPKKWLRNKIDEIGGHVKGVLNTIDGNNKTIYNPSSGILQLQKDTAYQAAKGFMLANGIDPQEAFGKEGKIDSGKSKDIDNQAIAGMLHLIKLNEKAEQKINDPEFRASIVKSSNVDNPLEALNKRDLIAMMWNAPSRVKKNNVDYIKEQEVTNKGAFSTPIPFLRETKEIEGTARPASTYANNVSRKILPKTRIIFNRKGGESTSVVNIEGNEIGIVKKKNRWTPVFVSDENTPMHEEGGQQIEVPKGTQVFNYQLMEDVEEAIKQGRSDVIEQHLIPARDHILVAAKKLGNEYAGGTPSTIDDVDNDGDEMRKGGSSPHSANLKFIIPRFNMIQKTNWIEPDKRNIFKVPSFRKGGTTNPPNYQSIGNLVFDSNLAKPLWNMQTGEPVLEVQGKDGKAYKVVRRNNGSYEYYNPDADKNTLLYEGATAYESLPESKTKDIVGMITGADNYRNYLRSGEELIKNPNVGNATKFVVNAIGSAPIVPQKTWSHLIEYGIKGDIIKKGINWIPTIYETGKWAGKEAIQSSFQINPDEQYKENNEIDLSNPIMRKGGKLVMYRKSYSGNHIPRKFRKGGEVMSDNLTPFERAQLYKYADTLIPDKALELKSKLKDATNPFKERSYEDIMNEYSLYTPSFIALDKASNEYHNDPKNSIAVVSMPANEYYSPEEAYGNLGPVQKTPDLLEQGYNISMRRTSPNNVGLFYNPFQTKKRLSILDKFSTNNSLAEKILPTRNIDLGLSDVKSVSYPKPKYRPLSNVMKDIIKEEETNNAKSTEPQQNTKPNSNSVQVKKLSTRVPKMYDLVTANNLAGAMYNAAQPMYNVDLRGVGLARIRNNNQPFEQAINRIEQQQDDALNRLSQQGLDAATLAATSASFDKTLAEQQSEIAAKQAAQEYQVNAANADIQSKENLANNEIFNKSELTNTELQATQTMQKAKAVSDSLNGALDAQVKKAAYQDAFDAKTQQNKIDGAAALYAIQRNSVDAKNQTIDARAAQILDENLLPENEAIVPDNHPEFQSFFQKDKSNYAASLPDSEKIRLSKLKYQKQRNNLLSKAVKQQIAQEKALNNESLQDANENIIKLIKGE